VLVMVELEAEAGDRLVGMTPGAGEEDLDFGCFRDDRGGGGGRAALDELDEPPSGLR
jgi:hypothetical protein